MSQNTAGIITSTPVHECNFMFDWEAELLGNPREDYDVLVLQVRRECGNAHPQKMYDDHPVTYEVAGLVLAKKAQSEWVDIRDVIIDGLHITWRLLDQYLPGGGFIAIGQVMMGSGLPARFVWFEGNKPTTPTMTSDIQAYIDSFDGLGYGY